MVAILKLSQPYQECRHAMLLSNYIYKNAKKNSMIWRYVLHIEFLLAFPQ
jgi:hypothetical protein